jgi:hypothetical protein
VASGNNYVSSSWVTFYAPAGTRIDFNPVTVSNPLSSTDIQLYVGAVYTYKLTVPNEYLTNATFKITTPTSIVYYGVFGGDVVDLSTRKVTLTT